MSGQSYAGLALVADRQTRDVLRLLYDRIASLEGRDADLRAWRAAQNAGGFQLKGLGDPTAPQDAVSLAYADRTFGPDAMSVALASGGAAPLNVTGLKGILFDPQIMGIRVIPDGDVLPDVSTARTNEVITWKGKLYYFDITTNPGTWVVLSTAASILTDTHANRLLNYLAVNQSLDLLFYETDRTVFYRIVLVAGVKTWRYVIGTMRGALIPVDDRPIDLGLQDENFRFEGTDYGEHYRWDGTALAWVRFPDETPKTNQVRNGSFEWWETWTPAATPAVLDPTFWVKSGAGNVSRTTALVKVGTYAALFANTAANALVETQTCVATISSTTNNAWRGQQVVYGCWVLATAGTRARIRLDDGVVTTNSEYHTGSGNWEFLLLQVAIDLSATKIDVQCRVETGGAISVYFDGAVLTTSSVPPRTVLPHAIDTLMYPFRAEVYNSANQSIPDATDTALAFDSEATDKGELHSVAANTERLTVPVGGGGVPSIWHVYAQVEFAANATGFRAIFLRRNGTIHFLMTVTAIATAAKATKVQCTGSFFDVADGDYFDAVVYQNSGGALNVIGGAASTFLGAYRVV